MDRPKIGLALGSGAARGFAHIGVIQELKKNNISIDYVAGSSIGAVIGAFFCAGVSLERITEILECIDIKHLLDFSFSKGSLIKGKKLEDFFRLFLDSKHIEDLEVPLKIVATDLRKAERIVFSEGDVIKAIRSSIAIPGIFSPIRFEEKILVDGGLIDRVPSSVVRNMGADIVIGVDVGFMPGDDYNPRNIVDIITQSIGIMETQILKNRITNCDILLKPKVLHLCPYSFKNIRECIDGGIKEVQDNMKSIELMINKKIVV